MYTDWYILFLLLLLYPKLDLRAACVLLVLILLGHRKCPSISQSFWRFPRWSGTLWFLPFSALKTMSSQVLKICWFQNCCLVCPQLTTLWFSYYSLIKIFWFGIKLWLVLPKMQWTNFISYVIKKLTFAIINPGLDSIGMDWTDTGLTDSCLTFGSNKFVSFEPNWMIAIS